MTDDRWDRVRNIHGTESITLGPIAAYKLRETPRDMAFMLSRYKFAAKMLPTDRPVDVLEIGCGEGLGTVLLAQGGHRVTGTEIDEAALVDARRAFGNSSVTFVKHDIFDEPIGTFRAAIALDVIEHIAQADEERFFRSVIGHLQPDGLAILGTPNQTAEQYQSEQNKIGHINLFDAERLTALGRRFFDNVFLFGMNDEVLHTGFAAMCHYLLIVCTGPKRSEG